MSALSLALALGVVGTANTGQHVKDLGSPSQKVRVSALVALAKMGSRAAPALRPICDRVRDRSDKVTAAAFEAVEKIRPELYTPLREYLLGGAGADRAAALTAIGELGDKGRPAAGILLRLAEGRVAYVIRGEGQLNGMGDLMHTLELIGSRDALTFAVLKLAASAKMPDGTTRHNAVVFLRRWGNADLSRRKDVVAAISPCLDSANPELVCACLQALGDFGADALPALPAVKRLKLAKDAAVRAAATDAAERIERKP